MIRLPQIHNSNYCNSISKIIYSKKKMVERRSRMTKCQTLVISLCLIFKGLRLSNKSSKRKGKRGGGSISIIKEDRLLRKLMRLSLRKERKRSLK